MRWLVTLLLVGCLPSLEDECADDDGCQPGKRCSAGVCIGDAGQSDVAPPDGDADAPPPDGWTPDGARPDGDRPDGAPPADAGPPPADAGRPPTDGRVVDAQPDGPDLGAPTDAAPPPPDIAIPFDSGVDAAPACEPALVAEEVCNGLDDDCNGTIDDVYAFEDEYALADPGVLARSLSLSVDSTSGFVAWAQLGRGRGPTVRPILGAGEVDRAGNRQLGLANEPLDAMTIAFSAASTVAAWHQTADRTIVARRVDPDDGAGIGPRYTLGRNRLPTEPAIATDGQQHYLLLWIADRSSICGVRIEPAQEGLSVGDPFCPYQSARRIGDLRVARGAGGFGVVWTQGGAAMFGQALANGEWAVPQVLSPNGSAPTLGAAGQGYVVAWVEERGPVVARVDGEEIRNRLTIERDAPAFAPSVAQSDAGVVVVWAERSNAAQRLHAGFLNADGLQGVTPLRIEAHRFAVETALQPRRGGVWLAWIEASLADDGSTGTAPHLGIGALRCP